MRKTARQERISHEVQVARENVIHFELMVDYLKDAKEKVTQGELDVDALMSIVPAHKSLDDTIVFYEEQRKVCLHRLNFFKELRRKELNRISEKEALKVKNTVPQEIKVSVVDTITKK